MGGTAGQLPAAGGARPWDSRDLDVAAGSQVSPGSSDEACSQGSAHTPDLTPPIPLTSAVFDRLAAGGGGPRDIEPLRRAVVRERLIAWRELADLVDEHWPASAAAAALRAATDSLARAWAAGGWARATLSYPTVGGWLSTCLRATYRACSAGAALPPAETGAAGAVAVVAALRAGHRAELAVHPRAGRLWLPGLGVAAVALEDWCRVEVTGPGEVVVRAPGRRWELPANGRDDPSDWRPVCPVRPLRPDPVLDDVDPYRGDGLPFAPRLDAAARAHWADLWARAGALLERLDPEQAGAIAAGITAVVPLRPGNRAGVRGATMYGASRSDTVGAVAMVRPAGGQNLALTLAHEFQHMKLEALSALVDLHDRSPEAGFRVPWRPDPRPIGAALHGAYAFLAMAEFWRRRRDELSGPAAARAGAESVRLRDAVLRALAGIAPSPRLTPLGRRFVAGMLTALERTSPDDRGRPGPVADLGVRDRAPALF